MVVIALVFLIFFLTVLAVGFPREHKLTVRDKESALSSACHWQHYSVSSTKGSLMIGDLR